MYRVVGRTLWAVMLSVMVTRHSDNTCAQDLKSTYQSFSSWGYAKIKFGFLHGKHKGLQ